MCWVALDRGITIAKRYGFPADILKWEETKETIRSEVQARGWSKEKNSFVQHYETDTLDSSNLLIPIFGFLPFEDPRVISTIEATERELDHEGFLYRYVGEDGLPGKEGTFLLCSFWLVDCLIGLGRLTEAEFLLRKLEGTANHVGLFSEQYDPQWRQSLGNVPQALTHIGYINSVIKLLEAKGLAREGETETKRLSMVQRILPFRILLNDGDPTMTIPSKDISSSLKNTMNVLRGAFFDTAGSRVAYERMQGSDPYSEYVELSYGLKDMNLGELSSKQEQLAFWINLYNVIIIHGVIELGIRDSVKEVRGFFKRVCYQLSDMRFTPYEIEHGILRGNRRPPHGISPVFGKEDPRRSHIVQVLEPKIHFALVCASSSCPPIDVYTPQNLEEELNISGQTFLNAGGIVLDRPAKRVRLSRIFRWYARDFGKTDGDRLRFIAPFLYEERDRCFLEEHADELKIDYQRYDWRLNRT